MSNCIKATRATLTIGAINLDCLQFPDGSYHFYQNQIRDQLGIQASDKTGKKYVKPLIHAESERLTSRINHAKVEGSQSKLKTWRLDLLTKVVAVYAVKLKNDFESMAARMANKYPTVTPHKIIEKTLFIF